MASTINISLPDNVKAFVDAQAESRGLASAEAYVEDLVHRHWTHRSLARDEIDGILNERLQADDKDAIEIPHAVLAEGDIVEYLAQQLRVRSKAA